MSTWKHYLDHEINIAETANAKWAAKEIPKP